MIPETMKCYLVRKAGKDQIESGVESRPTHELPAGDVLIRVAYSSLNYKDALAATGHPGVARSFPHIPGIDVVGEVVESSSPDCRSGDQVLVTSYELGVERWGGWAEFVRVRAEWITLLPAALSPHESMILGTAGLTAGLCIQALQRHEVRSESGEVLVTGATGGVGIIAVKLLSKLGYNVVAVSGKSDKHAWLRQHGATRVVGREEVLDDDKRALLSARWAGAVDTVGGRMLASVLRAIRYDGCVACCGLVGGAELPTTVHPFILRGVTLAGIDSAWCPQPRREEVWKLLASEWKPEDLDSIATTIRIDQLADRIPRILAGQSTGRTVVSFV